MFAEVHGRLVEMHPPLYDKNLYANREIAKFMSAKSFKYLMEAGDYDWIDLNAGVGSSWKEIVQDHQNGEFDNYRWKYVPKEITKGHTNEKAYRVFIDLRSFHKNLKISENYQFSRIESLKLNLIRFLYWWKGERIKRMSSKIKQVINL